MTDNVDINSRSRSLEPQLEASGGVRLNMALSHRVCDSYFTCLFPDESTLLEIQQPLCNLSKALNIEAAAEASQDFYGSVIPAAAYALWMLEGISIKEPVLADPIPHGPAPTAGDGCNVAVFTCTCGSRSGQGLAGIIGISKWRPGRKGAGSAGSASCRCPRVVGSRISQNISC